ncbi:MAG: hypothetical protein HY537_03170 [Deltaproteobacteria bacterium]|nr:hypothetical protein [Deltaproteobacteria bacterium]
MKRLSAYLFPAIIVIALFFAAHGCGSLSSSGGGSGDNHFPQVNITN